MYGMYFSKILSPGPYNMLAILRSYCTLFDFECSIDKIWADWPGSIIRPVCTSEDITTRLIRPTRACQCSLSHTLNNTFTFFPSPQRFCLLSGLQTATVVLLLTSFKKSSSKVNLLNDDTYQ